MSTIGSGPLTHRADANVATDTDVDAGTDADAECVVGAQWSRIRTKRIPAPSSVPTMTGNARRTPAPGLRSAVRISKAARRAALVHSARITTVAPTVSAKVSRRVLSPPGRP
jgi:hypothetical protein